jgi:hypothetical protein
LGGSGWKLYLVCELESGSGQLFEFNQKKQAQGGLSYLRTRKLHGTRQSRPHPSSRVSRTWEEVPTLSNQVPPYSTFLIDKGRAPARSGVARFEARFRLLPWPLTPVQRIWHLFAFIDLPRRIARERVPTIAGARDLHGFPYADAHGRRRRA